MKKIILLILPLIVAVGAGCATTQDQGLVSKLQMRVGELERQIAVRDEQVESLQYDIKDMAYEIDRLKSRQKKDGFLESDTGKTTSSGTTQDAGIIRVDVGVENVQKALKKAGYYKGEVDGKIGGGTRRAIEKFQKDHGLKADGIIGKRTWLELKTYLE